MTFPVVEAALTEVVRAKASLLGLMGGRGVASGSLFGMIVTLRLIASVTRHAAWRTWRFQPMAEAGSSAARPQPWVVSLSRRA